MEKVLVKDLFKDTKKYIEKDIILEGWIRTIRDSKNFGFIELNDGSFFYNVQIVFSNNLSNFEEICKLSISSTIKVEGKFILTENAKQPFEIQAQNIEIESLSENDYPLQKKRHSFEYLRTIAHLRPRSNTFNAVFRVRSALAYAIHKFFQEKGFVYVNTPLITASDAEGAGEMFNVNAFDFNNLPEDEDGNIDFSKDFFGKPAHLTVSGQLNAETFAEAFRNVYTFGPTFRAEDSNTVKHAAEFWMVEPEICFADLEDDMNLAEEMIKYIFKYVIDNYPEEMKFFNDFIDKNLLDRLYDVINSEFARITYTDAIAELEKHNDEFEYKVSWGVDLQTEHERYLCEKIFQKPDDMNLAEEMIKYIFKYVIDNYPEEMKFFNDFIDKNLLDRLYDVINSEFARITYTDAIAELEKHNDEFEYKVSWGVDLQTEHERYLCEKIFQKPVFVTDYPKEIKAFYMKLNDDGKTVAATDLLAPGIGEIIGGSQREDDYNKLLNRIKELNMPIENYDWYLDLRKYGSCKHAGFGLGFERAIMYLTGMQNIRDVIPFPRTPNNCDF